MYCHRPVPESLSRAFVPDFHIETMKLQNNGQRGCSEDGKLTIVTILNLLFNICIRIESLWLMWWKYIQRVKTFSKTRKMILIWLRHELVGGEGDEIQSAMENYIAKLFMMLNQNKNMGVKNFRTNLVFNLLRANTKLCTQDFINVRACRELMDGMIFHECWNDRTDK